MKHAWGMEQCPTCQGSGWDWCPKCESTCDHDRICPRCNGNEQVPVKIEGFALFAAGVIGERLYRTRREALAAIERIGNGLAP